MPATDSAERRRLLVRALRAHDAASRRLSALEIDHRLQALLGLGGLTGRLLFEHAATRERQLVPRGSVLALGELRAISVILHALATGGDAAALAAAIQERAVQRRVEHAERMARARGGRVRSLYDAYTAAAAVPHAVLQAEHDGATLD